MKLKQLINEAPPTLKPSDLPDPDAAQKSSAPASKPTPTDEPSAESKPTADHKPVQVKFNISRVRQYNPGKKFLHNYGTVVKVSKDAMDVAVDNYNVVTVNFQDVIPESLMRYSAKLVSESIYKFQKNDSLDYLVNSINEYGPEFLSQLDYDTLASINKIDPILARDLYSAKEIFKRLLPYIDRYNTIYLNEMRKHLHTRLLKEIKSLYSEDKLNTKGAGFGKGSGYDKGPKINNDAETEFKTIAKKYNPKEVEIKTGDDNQYTDSLSNREDDYATAKLIANELVDDTNEYYPTKVEILGAQFDPTKFNNQYYNTEIKVDLSNGDKLKIWYAKGSAAYNPTIRVRKMIIKKGNDVIYDGPFEKEISMIGKVYRQHINAN